jgi:hypothetical protein
VRRVLNDPREKGSSSKNRGGAEIPKDQFTLHDASLGGHMDAAVQKVNVDGVYPFDALGGALKSEMAILLRESFRNAIYISVL